MKVCIAQLKIPGVRANLSPVPPHSHHTREIAVSFCAILILTLSVVAFQMTYLKAALL